MNIVRFLIFALALGTVFGSAIAAQSRHIVVNGAVLKPGQIAQFDAAQCARIPDGSYWWNPLTNAWGYAGNPRVQGFVGQGCRNTGNRGRRKSLSERGLLYTPGDLNFR